MATAKRTVLVYASSPRPFTSISRMQVVTKNSESVDAKRLAYVIGPGRAAPASSSCAQKDIEMLLKDANARTTASHGGAIDVFFEKSHRKDAKALIKEKKKELQVSVNKEAESHVDAHLLRACVHADMKAALGQAGWTACDNNVLLRSNLSNLCSLQAVESITFDVQLEPESSVIFLLTPNIVKVRQFQTSNGLLLECQLSKLYEMNEDSLIELLQSYPEESLQSAKCTLLPTFEEALVLDWAFA
eukprot:TRINITY_DN4635_c0_g1_i3.p1 TRINITY_DN4635_c0_g1~~TRINITY_DN4635_c0_g1_i3.p1  ORF type:complete len:259 (+),score=32.24 TRINITY_DN4635_c0_g1_i3:43-777(+)